MVYAPILTEAQIDRIRAFGKARRVVAGQILYEPGEETPPVFVVITGRIKIVAVVGGEDQIVTTWDPGQFSGELLMVAGRRSIYRCQVVDAGQLIELCARGFASADRQRLRAERYFHECLPGSARCSAERRGTATSW